MTSDGDGLVSRGGLAWLGEVADLSGLTSGFSQALAGVPRRRHDPGAGLAQLVIGLADGAECLTDMDGLRGQPALVGPVGSPTSLQRAFAALGPMEPRRLAGARRISLTGALRRATPKTIRHRLLHVAAWISPRRLRLDHTWPWTAVLLDAVHRLRTRLTQPPRSVPIRPALHPGL